MGYPYRFDELTVVDLPSEDRHELYRDDARPVSTETPQGLVTYRYHSMTDLSSYPSQSFDMVYSGQSIEHVTRRQAGRVLAQARRVLRPGGILALDTPNRRLTRLQQAAFIDPDHKYEYSHPEMAAMLRGNGFVLERAVGINYGGESVARGVFDVGELATRRGVFDEIEDCYLLGYVCRRPGGPAPAALARRARWRVAGPEAFVPRAGRAARRMARKLRHSAESDDLPVTISPTVVDASPNRHATFTSSLVVSSRCRRSLGVASAAWTLGDLVPHGCCLASPSPSRG